MCWDNIKKSSRFLSFLMHNDSHGDLGIPGPHSGIFPTPVTPPLSLSSTASRQWPILAISNSGRKLLSLQSDTNRYNGRGFNGVVVTQPVNDADRNAGEPPTNFGLDFGWLFCWLERAIWFTMLFGIAWALAFDFYKATSESCMKETRIWNVNVMVKHIPFNLLPSLSRSMSSFGVGKFLWTIMMACVFVARFFSNHFLHQIYESWYADTIFNKFILGFAYILDTSENLSLIMIPAFSLDSDPREHALFFQVFIVVIFVAEVFQYFTKFLERKEDFPETSDHDINNYYEQIGVLIIFQAVFIAFMMIGYCLHNNLCGDYCYTVFALGEYITVIINVRFKRDTVLFVK